MSSVGFRVASFASSAARAASSCRAGPGTTDWWFRSGTTCCVSYRPTSLRYARTAAAAAQLQRVRTGASMTGSWSASSAGDTSSVGAREVAWCDGTRLSRRLVWLWTFDRAAVPAQHAGGAALRALTRLASHRCAL